MNTEIHYDRSIRPLEFWAATLATTSHPSSLSEDDLEAVICLAFQYCHEAAPAQIKSLAHYVLGKAILRLKPHYPEWCEWVGRAAILASEWALAVGDALLVERSEALFVEYVRTLGH